MRVCYIANIRESTAICNRLRLLALVPLLLSPVPAPLLAQSPISHSTRQVESHWFPPKIRPEPLEAATSAPIATPLPIPIPTPSASPVASPQVWDGPQSRGPSDDVWYRLRMCESTNNYSNNDTGRNGHYGAYQFSFTTWAGVGGAGNPADASPAEQDMRARMLQARYGWSQWECAAKIGL